MHYYQFNIADYRKDTTHLTMLEHGAYRQLLDWYYLNEQPIPLKTEVVFRRLSAKTDEEKTAIEMVLRDMFEYTENGYVQHRVKREIEQYQAKADRAREVGKLGGRPKKTEQVISGLSNETYEKANHKPLTNNQDINTIVLSKADDACPHQKIIDLYHEKLPMLTKIKVWNVKRQNQLKARWREEVKRQNLEYWERLFEYIAESDFLTGRTGKFLADLEWITKSENFVKIIERKYENRSVV